MKIIRSIPEFRQWRRSVSSEQTVGFVPTMGALHAGHMKLIEECRVPHSGNALTVVSIFVNPLQFGPKEDFTQYPRPFEQDRSLCEIAGVDILFVPEASEFYSPDHSTYCEVEGLDQYLCGASRPGHFRGVCTVVLKLFNIVQPQRAYFGKKDIQQALILKKMVIDLSLDLEVNLVDTVREPSGLALSSRNAYLGEDEKQRATALYRSLQLAQNACSNGERNAEKIKKLMQDEIEKSTPTRVDYVEIVSQSRMQPVSTVDIPVVIAVAVYFGKTRLIDNILIG